MSKIEVSAGLIPSEDGEGRVCSRLLAFAYKWASFSCVSSHHLPSMHVCVQISHFNKNTSHIWWIRVNQLSLEHMVYQFPQKP